MFGIIWVNERITYDRGGKGTFLQLENTVHKIYSRRINLFWWAFRPPKAELQFTQLFRQFHKFIYSLRDAGSADVGRVGYAAINPVLLILAFRRKSGPWPQTRTSNKLKPHGIRSDY